MSPRYLIVDEPDSDGCLGGLIGAAFVLALVVGVIAGAIWLLGATVSWVDRNAELLLWFAGSTLVGVGLFYVCLFCARLWDEADLKGKNREEEAHIGKPQDLREPIADVGMLLPPQPPPNTMGSPRAATGGSPPAPPPAVTPSDVDRPSGDSISERVREILESEERAGRVRGSASHADPGVWRDENGTFHGPFGPAGRPPPPPAPPPGRD